MAEPIRALTRDDDILLWPNGHWEFRHNVDPAWLKTEPNEDYEVIAAGTERWSAIREA